MGLLYRKIIRPVLFLLPAECSHNLTIAILKIAGRLFKAKTHLSNPVYLMGLQFPNRIGLAAGLDKNAVAIDGFALMPFGFIEVGTVTPKPQSGNVKPRLFRLSSHRALINRFGFNNCGVDQFIKNIQSNCYRGILGINLGKNAVTPLEQAANDYIYSFKKVYPYASYVTINISSPNTANLRDLQQREQLDDLLKQLKQQQAELRKQYNKYVPLVVKIAPDVTAVQLAEIAELLLLHGIDGVIATNTSSARAGVESLPEAEETGGLSGEPIYTLSLNVVQKLAELLQGQIPIIACGGISSIEQAEAMLSAGADLIQIYTGLIYQGPGLVKELLKVNPQACA